MPPTLTIAPELWSRVVSARHGGVSREADRLRLALAAGLPVSFAATVVALRVAGLTIDPVARGSLLVYVFAAVALVADALLRRAAWRAAGQVRRAVRYYAVFVAMAMMGAVASYPVAALTHGFADADLQRIDVALGFDWVAWYRAVSASTTLQAAGTAAYRSIFLSPALLLGWYAATGMRAAAYRFLFAFWLTAVITLALFALMPAVGPFSYLWHAPIPYMPESELWQPDLIPQLRDHAVRVVDLGHLRGLVSAPSFHAAAAVLYMAAAWPIRRLRWPLVAMNAAMLLSTPVEGTHYLIDMLLGAGVAGVVLVVVRRSMRRA